MMRFSHFACIMICLAPGVPLRAQNTALDQGIQLIREGKFDQAVVKLEQAHRIAPENATIENLLGIAETKLGRIAAADVHYRNAIRIDPSQPAPHRNLGVNLLTEKNYEASGSELREASRLDPRDKFAHFYLLMLALATNHDAEAVHEASLAGDLVDHDTEASIGLIEAEIRLGHVDQAATAIERLEAANLLTAAQEYQIAVLLAQHGLYNEAVRCFRHIASLESSWQNRYNLALALLYANHPDEASSLLAALHHEQPANADILMYLGAAYEMQEKMPEALDAYRAAVAADPSNPDRMLDYTRLLMDTDRYDEAIQAIQNGMGKTDSTVPLQVRLGVIEMVKGNYDSARDAFQTALAADPDLDVAYVGLAETYAREANDEEAIRILEAAREKRPGHYLLEYYFGLLASRLGREQEAIVALDNAARLQPNSPDPFFELGKLYVTQQDWRRARKALERAIELNPRLAPAHYQLSRVYAHLGLNSDAGREANEARSLIESQRNEALSRQRESGASFQMQTSVGPPQ
ncbi:MAG TPA: tetratricopeptide repeat protein [Terracidiphilus sp.]|nr:tetratricopeptide repeat protein [Terracidiphilus sp.]